MTKKQIIESLINDVQTVDYLDNASADAVHKKAVQAVKMIFGQGSPEVIDISVIKWGYGYYSNPSAAFEQARTRVLNLLRSYVYRLEHFGEPRDLLEELRGQLSSAGQIHPEQALYMDGQSYDAVASFSNFIREAKHYIVLIDGYIDGSVIGLFSEKQPNVNVHIITKEISEGIKTHVKRFNEQYGQLNTYNSTLFHDRFLIIDGKFFITLGASIKDAGKKAFMVTRINDPKIQEVLLERVVAVVNPSA